MGRIMMATAGRRPVLLALAVAVAVAVAVAAPEGAEAQRSRARSDAGEQRIDTTFAASAAGVLEVRMPGIGSGSGDVVITGWDRNEIRVAGETDRGQLTLNVSRGRVEVGTRSDAGRARIDRLEIHAPAGTQVRIDNGSGDISVRGIGGGLEATTFNGDIDAADLGDRVELKTFNGDISVARVAGRAMVTASNGDLELEDVRGEIEVATLNGDITLRRVTSRNVRAKTMSGRISYDGAIDPTGEYSLNAFSGEIDVVIPPNTGATLSVSTFSGTIDSPDFPLTLKPGARSRESKGQSMTFDLGNGGGRISLESFSGSILIRARRTGG